MSKSPKKQKYLSINWEVYPYEVLPAEMPDQELAKQMVCSIIEALLDVNERLAILRRIAERIRDSA